MRNIEDPNGVIQKAADKTEQVVDAAEDIVGVAAPFIPSPWKEGILGVIAIAGAAVGAVQKLKRGKAENATREIVMGIEDAKKTGALVLTPEIASSFNAAQSIGTKKIVDTLQ